MPLRLTASLIACLLGGAALAAALILLPPGLPAAAAAAVGLAAALAGGLACLAVAGRRDMAALRAEIAATRLLADGMQARQEAIERELARARDEARQIHAALTEAGRAGGGVSQVMAELRVLQRLVEQLRERQEEGTRPLPPPAPAAAPGLPPAPMAPMPAPAAPPPDAGPLPMLDRVRDALSGGRVDLLLQPIMALPQRRRRFYECFVRIRDAGGAALLPEQYLEVAEREGLLPAIDNLLLFRCAQMIRRARQRSAGIGFFCNVSPHSLSDRDFLQDFGDFLDQNRELASSLILEMRQGSLDLADGDLAAEMDRLAGLGLRFSIDAVTELPLDPARLAERHVKFVKLAAGRLAGADPEAPWDGSPFQLRRMLGLAGIDLIAEGIETEKQLLELLELNIAYGQGPLFGEPKPAPEG
mgnify:CR=1 FL=1